MFGIGSTEFLVILLVALLVLGPKSLSKISRTVGKYMGEFRRVSTDFQRTLNAEVAEEERKDAREAVRRKAEAARAARAKREEAKALAAAPEASGQAEAPAQAETSGQADAPVQAAGQAQAEARPAAPKAPEQTIPQAPEGSPLEAALRRAAEEAAGTPARQTGQDVQGGRA
ncbi:MAG: twin-arginine translocase TatA/TatE family subunit [Desulfovibrio sp.]|jgi:sec-independent protein translocase protein TatB|nr:twin-arginine translocase TatA/TatE family subunit [Desulfovibrio sp.]